MRSFQDCICIVTGGASGIGKALCAEVAHRGAQVIITDINSDLGEKTAETIKESGGNAQFVTLDVTDYASFQRVVDDTISDFGRLDYLFNNAGIAIFSEARDCTQEDWCKVIDTDLYGPVNGVASAYPQMVRQGFGHIVNIASIAGLVAPTHLASYAASKHGVVGLSLSLRIEAAHLGVKVSVVCPGFIRTPIYQSRTINLDQNRLLNEAPKGMSPEKCAGLILKTVERNKAIILITKIAKVFHLLQRISPGLYLYFARRIMREVRNKYRLKSIKFHHES
ncbi:MAG: SDR family oxidoreductase [Desulfobacterales bacterium]|nr:MAG: SDR family oxidoreductase [Desulfobacterales bacterium]